MIEMTLYGRGGQGGVTLAKLIATAWFIRGKWSQAFGLYAAERSGAPIQAFVRFDDDEITNNNQVREPDHVIVLDPTLIGPSILAGLKPGGWIILNTPTPAEHWTDVFPGRLVATIDATQIAVNHGLGTKAVPIVNTTIFGAVAKVFDLSAEEIEATLEELKFGGGNVSAAHEAFERVTLVDLPGEAVVVATPPPAERVAGILDNDLGGFPKIRTGNWATRRPDRAELTPPCNHICPAGNNVQGFVRALAEERPDDALGILLETSPLPGVCGRVCPAPCMDACNRNEFDEGVNVRELERYAADHGAWPQPTTPWRLERVAVIGSGPAGLSSAYHLARFGYHVSVYEASDELGGVLRDGIPDYRLPKEVLDHEIGHILMHGVTAYTEAFIDQRALLDLTYRYSAVFVGTGLQATRNLTLGGAPADKVTQGIEFLEGVHRNEESVADLKVIVIGGGNTAIDAARSALRLGAESVRIVYRRTRAEMPAIHEEVDAALEEGVILNELVQPVRVEDARLRCVRMKLGEVDESGRRSPVVDDSADAEFDLACDRVILALGQTADVSILNEGSELQQDGALIGLAGAPIFVGGDFATSEGTVAAAIGSGRRAAMHIHRALTGEDLFPQPEAPVATADVLQMHVFSHSQPHRGREVSPKVRRESFMEVHVGFQDDEGRAAAVAEAGRCFSCGVCNECDRCLNHCPEGILTRDGDGYRFNYDYCKGCGVCASECPRGVVIMSAL